MENLTVYIAGSSRTGSTLLDLLLNNHEHIASIGEMDRLPVVMANSDDATCSCGVPFALCDFWQRVNTLGRQKMKQESASDLLLERAPSFRVPSAAGVQKFILKALVAQPYGCVYNTVANFLAQPYYQAGIDCHFWFDVIREATGCPVVVDSSKVAIRMKALYFARPAGFRIIHMIRDGRAVAASEIRRTKRAMAVATKRWRDAQQKVIYCLKGIPKSQVYRLHYEKFCEAPEASMRDICRFLGLAYREDLLRLNKDNIHNIGGNPMRLRRNETEIKLDESWRKALSREDLEIFDRIAGNLNLSFGYH